MTRAFTEEEKAHIRQHLLEMGRRLFLTEGLKKTRIEDLTQPLGLAKSTFYLFFESKEALYAELLMQERARLEQQVMTTSFEATEDICEALTRFIQVVIAEMEKSELTQRLMAHPEEFALLTRWGSLQQLASSEHYLLEKIMPFIQRGQESGQIIETSPDTIAGVLLAVIRLLTFHKGSIGQDVYPNVRNLLITLITRGLKQDTELQAE